MELDRLIEGVVALRVAAMAPEPLFRRTPAARAEMRRFAAKAVAAAGPGGREALFDGDRLRAALVLWAEPDSWYGVPVQRCMLDAAADDAEAIEWAIAALTERAPRLTGDFDLGLIGPRNPLLSRILALPGGFGIDSIELVGAPEPALTALRARHDPPRTLDHLGLALTPLAPEQVDAVVELKRATFAREPRFCWFGANEGFLEKERAALTDAAEDGEVRWVVHDKSDRVLGYVGSDFNADNPLWGRQAGVDFVFAPEIRGHGVVKTAYRRLLERWVDQEVDVFKGGTSQPSIMALARLMGRRHTATYVRTRTWFPPEHFRAFVGA